MKKKKYNGLNTTLIYQLKKKIKDLKTSEEKFRTVFEGANDGILAADVKTKNFVIANPAICKITGYSQTELLKLGVTKIHPKKDLPYVMSQVQKQMAKKIDIAKDIPILRKDKKIVYCDVNSSPITIGNKRLLVGFFRDITEQKKKDNMLLMERNRLQGTMDAVEGGITIQDNKYNIIYQNDFLKKRFGGLGGKCYSVYEGKKTICEGCPVKKAFRDGKVHTAERKVTMPNGGIVYWSNRASPIRDANGKVVACVELAVDITKRKAAENALKNKIKELEKLKKKLKKSKRKKK